MKQNPIHSAISLFLVVAITAALIGWLAFRDDGAITETVQVGAEGIRKAEEVKRQLEESSRSQLEI
jgi:hypothetical protein